MRVFFLGLAIGGATPCLALGVRPDMPTGACYVRSVDPFIHYCMDNAIEKVCYQAARNFKMAGKWIESEQCIDVRYK